MQTRPIYIELYDKRKIDAFIGSAIAHDNQTFVVIEPGVHIIFRGLFSSIAPHVAAAVIPPSAMSTKTSSGVPKVIILATLAVLATSAVVQHVRVGRCDGHHEMIDLDSRNGGLSNLAHHRRD